MPIIFVIKSCIKSENQTAFSQTFGPNCMFSFELVHRTNPPRTVVAKQEHVISHVVLRSLCRAPVWVWGGDDVPFRDASVTTSRPHTLHILTRWLTRRLQMASCILCLCCFCLKFAWICLQTFVKLFERY